MRIAGLRVFERARRGEPSGVLPPIGGIREIRGPETSRESTTDDTDSTAESPWPSRCGARDEEVVQGDVLPPALHVQADRALVVISGLRGQFG